MNRFALAFRLPVIVWQGLFFLGPLFFMIAMSFFLVKNYRMEEGIRAQELGADAHQGLCVGTATGTPSAWAGLATLVATLVAFPAAYALAFRVSEATRRWAIFLLIIPFFTSYLVRTFSWYVILAESGAINAGLGTVGLGPYTMLNTPFGTVVGYLTLTLPLVVILQTVALANIDRNLVQAARNLGCPPERTLFAVIVPLAKAGLIIAALFCFILSFGGLRRALLHGRVQASHSADIDHRHHEIGPAMAARGRRRGDDDAHALLHRGGLDLAGLSQAVIGMSARITTVLLLGWLLLVLVFIFAPIVAAGRLLVQLRPVPDDSAGFVHHSLVRHDFCRRRDRRGGPQLDHRLTLDVRYRDNAGLRDRLYRLSLQFPPQGALSGADPAARRRSR